MIPRITLVHKKGLHDNSYHAESEGFALTGYVWRMGLGYCQRENFSAVAAVAAIAVAHPPPDPTYVRTYVTDRGSFNHHSQI